MNMLIKTQNSLSNSLVRLILRFYQKFVVNFNLIMMSKPKYSVILTSLCQNVWHHEILDKIETGSSQVKSRSLDQILDCFTL